MPSGNLETLSASATDEEGVVTVTVGRGGVVTDLRLDDRVQLLSGATLSAEILRIMRQAQEALASSSSSSDEAELPVMPAAPPFPSFSNTPTLPHQAPGNGYESGRDSRAR
ncbi:YbaB/EbfC family nucleoid-associated protein [Actinoplanes bogorensis]|uniref:YbaB/EbfC family nucleoid-associated protein n=1 Tax=Paractinoplanes bogorensis TaxID=1610840 RepID=A0ABS5Z4A5_9ACTN|nr:YbaB/EbfC family nucleoid-associated protein [Actinoplanes bogorensis]MBU2670498.1 YbaB/EbfC family nucleoid-associated protein [Actinoplanes bogorensis]